MIKFASVSPGKLKSYTLLPNVALTSQSKSLYYTPSAKTPISLETIDLGSEVLCGQTSPSSDWSSRWRHRQECHKLSYEAIKARNKQSGKSTPEMRKKCRTRWSSHHCECYTRRTKLHYRLSSWMPKGLNYCGTCAKFTKRKRSHNGRCEFTTLFLPRHAVGILPDRFQAIMVQRRYGSLETIFGLILREEGLLEGRSGRSGSTIVR